MYSKFSMIQDASPQDKVLNTKLQALNQGKPKSFVTEKVDSKNARSGTKTHDLSA